MNALSTVSPLKYSEQELLSFLLSYAGTAQHPVAVWRLPRSPLTQVVISSRHQELDSEEFVEELDPGFLFAPFDKSAKRLFLKADQLFTFENGNLRPHVTSLEETSTSWLRDQLHHHEPGKYKPQSA